MAADLPWTAWLAGGLLLTAAAGLTGAAWMQQRHGSERSAAGKPGAMPQTAAQASSASASVAAPGSRQAGKPGHAASPLMTAPPASAQQVYELAYKRERDALRALAPLWQADLGEGDPCVLAQQQSLACFRNSGGLAQIKQLERPVVLALHDSRDQAIYAPLLGLKDQSAIIELDGHPYTLPWATLATLWRGDFVTYWRTPPDFHGKILPGNNGVAVEWLALQLSRLDKGPPPSGRPVFDSAMQSRVYAFQMAQGLKPDGVVGATTFMLINRAVGVDEPRLQMLAAHPGQASAGATTTARRDDVLHP